ATIQSCAQVALLLKDSLKKKRLDTYVKTSGSKGLQVYVPLNTPATFDATKDFSLRVASALERAHPQLVTTKMRKDVRTGKVLIDWSQNHPTKTTVCVYSLRAKPRPTVSTPLAWREVEAAAADYKAPLTFEAADVPGRVDAKGDLFEPVLTQKQRLPAA
ncbi:MAG TPA: ATP-dependent DNA ligase, partial [Candidatus Thermoplasmatota archaeon]|nr:ATP-dependent DNA ligase [Candidatus Thermoplasmatota archaeon]